MRPAPRRWRLHRAAMPASLLGLALLGPEPARATADPATPTPEPVLRVRIIDESGEPVVGATVRVLLQGLSAQRREASPETWRDPLVATSDERGAFAASGLPGKELTVRVEATGRAPVTLERIPAGASIDLLLRAGRELRGRVVAAATGTGLGGATVVACDGPAHAFGREACARARSEASGAFRLAGLPDGELQLRAEAPGHAVSALQTLALPAPGGTVPTLRLEPGARVRGRVLGDGDEPVAGARVYARPMAERTDAPVPPGDEWPTHAAADGSFELPGLPAGRRFVLLAYRSDRGLADGGSVRLDAGADVEGLAIALPAAAALTLRLVDAEGAAVESFEVLFRETSATPGKFVGPLEPWRVERGPEGRVTARIPRRGTFDVRFVPAGSREIDVRAVVLAPGRATDLGTLVAAAGGRIRGRVTDGAGEPLPQATVEAVWTELGVARVKRALADDDGRYVLAGLADLPVRVSASAAGFVAAALEGILPDSDDVDLRLDPTGGLAGRVRLREGGVPEAFLIVVHTEAEAPDAEAAGPAAGPRKESFTDEDGAYRIDDLAPGSYTVEARAEGRATGRRAGVRVEHGEIASVPVIDLDLGLELHGRVLDAADDSPVTGASLTATPEGGSLVAPTTSRRFAATADENGSFVLEGLEPGTHVVTADHPDYAPAEERAELTGEPDAEPLVLRLTPGGTLAGSVRDASGSPAAGRRIVVARDLAWREDLPAARTDADGRYELGRLAPGPWVVTLVPHPGATLRVQVQNAVIREGEVTRLDFDEASPITLEGTVTRDGRPLPGAQLFFAKTISLTDFKFASTDGAGHYEVGLDEPGRYRVLVEPGAGGASTDIDVPDLPRVRQDIRLDADGIGGTVADGDGQPLSGAVVSASPAAAQEGGVQLLVAETGADGRYTIAGLSPGIYRFTAAAPGFRVGVVQAVELVEGGDPLLVDFVLERGGALAGRLVDGLGNGIAGTAVLAAPAGSNDAWGAASATAVTDVNGAFRLTSPGDGPLDLAALPTAWAAVRRGGVVVPDGEEIVLQATRGGVLRVEVVDGQGAPRPGALVAVRAVPPCLGSELERLLRPPAVSDALGIARIAHLAPGSYEVTIEVAGGARASATVAEGSETLLRIELP